MLRTSSTTIHDIIEKLALSPHPEGGWYREIFRSDTTLETARGQRSALTTIYYMLSHGQQSRWHVVESDEVWHFYQGDGLELLTYSPESKLLERHLLSSGESSQSHVAVVAAGCWQAARPLGDFALVGCTVGPGFDFDDFKFVADLPGKESHFSGKLRDFSNLL